MEYEKAIKALQEIINKQSPVYLISSPEKIYPDLIEMEVSAEEAAILSYIFFADGFKKLSKLNDENEIINVLKTEKNLNTKTAKDLAHAFITILTSEQNAEWDAKKEEGFREFCSKSWLCNYNAFATFNQGNNQDYFIEGSYQVKVVDKMLFHEYMEQELKQTPYLKAETIQNLIETQIQNKIGPSFDYYCTCEPYYPPYVEDYYGNLEELIDDNLKKIGLKREDLEFTNSESEWY